MASTQQRNIIFYEPINTRLGRLIIDSNYTALRMHGRWKPRKRWSAHFCHPWTLFTVLSPQNTALCWYLASSYSSRCKHWWCHLQVALMSSRAARCFLSYTAARSSCNNGTQYAAQSGWQVPGRWGCIDSCVMYWYMRMCKMPPPFDFHFVKLTRTPQRSITGHPSPVNVFYVLEYITFVCDCVIGMLAK